MDSERSAASADFFHAQALTHLKNTTQDYHQHPYLGHAASLPVFPMLHSNIPLQHLPSPLFIQNMIAAAAAAASMRLQMPLHNFSSMTHFPTTSNHSDFDQWNCLPPLGTLDYRPMKNQLETNLQSLSSKISSSSVMMPGNSGMVKSINSEVSHSAALLPETTLPETSKLEEKLDSKEVMIQEMLRQATVPSMMPPRQLKLELSVGQSFHNNCSDREMIISSDECTEFIENCSLQCSTSSPLSTPPLLLKYNTKEETFEHQITSLPSDTSYSVKSPIKSKMQKCKQCNFLTESKEALWQHLHNHISPNKAIRCPKCPFITEYKHHLEYHIRNHLNSKPFQCEQCSYRCVNKSMLNSHMKSHTNVYQYRCANCSYATKYSHSLKQHLRKYNHIPAVTLNADGSVDLSVETVATETDVIANKSTPTPSSKLSSPTRGQFYFPTLFSPLLSSSVAIPNTIINGSPEECAAAATAAILIQRKFSSPIPFIGDGFNEPMDLSTSARSSEKILISECGGAPRLEDIVRRLQNADFKCKKERSSNLDTPHHFSAATDKALECCFCGLVFRDNITYRSHMNFHSSTSDNAFTCAQCQKPCRDRIEFNSHLLHASHA